VIDVDALIAPPTPTAALALDAATRWCSRDLVNHCLRSWVWAVALAERNSIEFDAELLFVATMLHDAGVAEHFDAHAVPFERAGGAVGWTFAAGAGWDAARRQRVFEIIERHMWIAVDPHEDAEGHLLESATSIDVAGAGIDQLDAAFLREVTAALPRGDFSSDFALSIHAQAVRKPTSNAARLDAAGRVDAGAAAWDRVLGGGEVA
jgi:HD superfamily phosphodiesterase